MPQKYKKYIKRGIHEPLEKIPFHKKAPLKRLVMLNNKMIKKANTRIAVHFINKLPKQIPPYSELHMHDCNEINLILSEKNKLTYKIQLGNEVYQVSSPATIFIPKGLKHSAEVVSGKGIFICLILKGKYKTKR